MKKAQTSIEVLLLIGGALLVAIIIGIALKSIATQSSNQAIEQIKCEGLNCDNCIRTAGCAGFMQDGTPIAPWVSDPAASCNNAQKTAFDVGGSCKAT